MDFASPSQSGGRDFAEPNVLDLSFTTCLLGKILREGRKAANSLLQFNQSAHCLFDWRIWVRTVRVVCQSQEHRSGTCFRIGRSSF